ncbi:MAG: hypothetical protein JRE40_06710 [Deltaproteobacteria bacterium]|nr:hypothetical protein [Deltaproteobacteria bacterium]
MPTAAMIDFETGEMLERPQVTLMAGSVKMAKVEKGYQHLKATLSMETQEMAPEKLQEIGRLIESGPVEITIVAMQSEMPQE